MSSKGKFLLIVNNIDTFWSHRLPLAQAIMADGWNLHLATSNASKDSRIAALGITPHDLPVYSSSLNPLLHLRVLRDILKAAKTVKPDMVHAVTIRYSFWTGCALHMARANMPAVFTVAGLGSLFNSDKAQIVAVRAAIVPLFRFAFNGNNRYVIFQNPDDAKALVRSGAVPKDRCGIIRGSGVDPVEFPYTPEPNTDEPIVLFCSRLLKAKGIGEFVHAARILKSKGITARFQVAGDLAPGNHDSVTKDELDHWKEEGTVEFLGQRSDVPQLMKDSAIVTLPSYYGEGVPKVLLEAAAIGRPIVTTNMPGCRETVEDGVTGILVEARNSWSLAEAFEKLLADKSLRQSMGEKGRARIEADFTVDKVNAKTLSVYRKLFPQVEKAASPKFITP